MNNFHAVGRIAAEIKLQKNEKGVVYTRFPLAISRGKRKIKTITWMQQMIIIMMTVAFLDMNMRTRGTFSKCFM